MHAKRRFRYRSHHTLLQTLTLQLAAVATLIVICARLPLAAAGPPKRAPGKGGITTTWPHVDHRPGSVTKLPPRGSSFGGTPGLGSSFPGWDSASESRGRPSVYNPPGAPAASDDPFKYRFTATPGTIQSPPFGAGATSGQAHVNYMPGRSGFPQKIEGGGATVSHQVNDNIDVGATVDVNRRGSSRGNTYEVYFGANL